MVRVVGGGWGGFPSTGSCFELVFCIIVRLCFNAYCALSSEMKVKLANVIRGDNLGF